MIQLYCDDCDETTSKDAKFGHLHRCRVCGGDLRELPAQPAVGPSSSSRLSALLQSAPSDSADVAEALASMHDTLLSVLSPDLPASNVHVTKDQLEHEVKPFMMDQQGAGLVSISIQLLGQAESVGCILASFCRVPSQDIVISGTVVLADPPYGETLPALLPPSPPAPFLLVMQRGRVSFLQKARVAQALGAACLVVAQQADGQFPFLMESGQEDPAVALDLPVVMVRHEDLEALQRHRGRAATLSLRALSPASFQCAVCMESMSSQTVARLPRCMHAYHAHCLAAWTAKHNSCPLCRARVRERKGGSRGSGDDGGLFS
eukprot:gene35560-43120_t